MTKDKTFAEVVKEFEESVEAGSHARFSKATFEEMATALLNDVDHKPVAYRMAKNEEGVEAVTTKEFSASEGVRKTIFNTLIDFGVDKQEAESVLTGDYKFKNLGGIHEFVSELLYNYARTRKFNFISKERFRGGLTIGNVEESTRTYSLHAKFNNGVAGESKVHYAQHETLKVDASAPEWVKTRL